MIKYRLDSLRENRISINIEEIERELLKIGFLR
jgi:hypothetical protein